MAEPLLDMCFAVFFKHGEATLPLLPEILALHQVSSYKSVMHIEIKCQLSNLTKNLSIFDTIYVLYMLSYRNRMNFRLSTFDTIFVFLGEFLRRVNFGRGG